MQKHVNFAQLNFLVKKVYSDQLINAGSSLFLASMLTNIFNYLFQIIMGRLLTPIEYGLMNSLLAIFMILAIPFNTLLMAIAKKTAESKAKGNLGSIQVILKRNYKKIKLFALITISIFWAFSPWVKIYLKAPSLIPILLLGLAIFVSFFPLINLAVLQGVQNFKWLRIGIASAGPLKFFCSLILVLLGFKVSGVIGGLALGAIILWLITYYPFTQNKIYFCTSKENSVFSIKTLMPVFLANLSFAILTQADMILIKHFFSSHEAGIYASASVLGKAIMYLPGAMALAMFPMVAESNALKVNCGYIIKKTLLMTVLLSGTGALILFLFPHFIIRFFFGVKYIESTEIVRYFGWAMLPMAILLIQMNYFLAKGKSFFSFILALAAIAEILLIFRFHDSIIFVIFIILINGGVFSIPGFLLLYYEARTEKELLAIKSNYPFSPNF